MKIIKTFLYVTILTLFSFEVSAEINLKIKIDQVVGTQTFQTVKKISANYNQDIVIAQKGLKNALVLNLKKFKDIIVNGNKINPVQIDMKVINDMKKTIGKAQTVTSFYNNSAQFRISNDLNILVNFEEI